MDLTATVMNLEDSMMEDAMRNKLETLHLALHGATTLDEKDRELLMMLSSDIESLLERGDAMTRQEHRPIVDRLRAAVSRFETSHPDLTSAMAQVTKTLADMGI